MWKVIKDIDGDKTEYIFETAWEAVKFVSEGYCYFDYKYIRTEKFNCATTEKVIPSERPDDYEYSDDYHCEPFDEELRWAYVDCYDAVISWEIIKVNKFELVDIKYINMDFFQMIEGKFLDLEQKEYQDKTVYIYANIANNELDIEESYVRYYPYSFENLYCAEDYELLNLNEHDDYIKEILLNSDVYKKYFNKK